MLLAMAALRQAVARPTGRVIVAHVQHGLRGVESRGDEQFVAELAADLALELQIARLDTEQLRSAARDGLEAAARRARHRALRSIAAGVGARYLALGHTRDDQVETVLFHLARGTGIAGLAGIPAVRLLDGGVTLVRPLLEISRIEVQAYLAALGQPSRSDSTNLDRRHSRNWMRHELLPLLRTRFPAVDQSISRVAQLAAEQQRLVDSLAAALLDRAQPRESPEGVELNIASWTDEAPTLIQAALKLQWERRHWPRQEMGFTQWRRLGFLAATPFDRIAQQDFPGEVRATRDGDILRLCRLADSAF